MVATERDRHSLPASTGGRSAIAPALR